MGNLLRSRKFVLALVVIIVELGALTIPELRPYAAELGGVLFAVVGVMGGLITFEDSVRLWATRPLNLKEAIKAAVEEALGTIPETPATIEPLKRYG